MSGTEIKFNRLCVLYVLLSILILTMTSCSQYKDYRENQSRENFNKNFEAFSKLEQMQRDDINVFAISVNGFKSFKKIKSNCPAYKNNNIEYEFCYKFTSNQGITDERWSDYKKLLMRANEFQMIYQYDKPIKRQVWFHSKAENDSGYVYMEYPPPKFFKKSSECQPIMPSQSCYIVLRKNWYMFSEKFALKQE